MTQKLVIFGTGEIASLARYYFENDSKFEVCGFTADDEYIEGQEFMGLPLVPLSEVNKVFPAEMYQMHVALSYSKLNRIREAKYHEAKELGYTLASYVSSRLTCWPDLKIGDNCFILEDQTLQPTISIGNNVMIWSGNHIGHGTRISDHTYIASQVVISGNCLIGKRCFIGVNATIKDFTIIEDDVFITMGASIVSNIQAQSVVLGARSTVLEAADPRASKIRDGYFGQIPA